MSPASVCQFLQAHSPAPCDTEACVVVYCTGIVVPPVSCDLPDPPAVDIVTAHRDALDELATWCNERHVWAEAEWDCLDTGAPDHPALQVACEPSVDHNPY